VRVHRFVGGEKRGALILQVAQVLLVPTICDARAQNGETTCEGMGTGGRAGAQHIYRKGEFPVPQTLRTKTTVGETAEEAIAPSAQPIWTNRSIQGVLVATGGHGGSTLRRTELRSNVIVRPLGE
jgi:hypothetical protein